MPTYKFTTRESEPSGNLIIEFLDLPQDKDFVKQLIRTFKPINIVVENYKDIWEQEEIVINASSDVGPFTIYRDAADYYYITVNDNPGTMKILEGLLIANSAFYKI